jgi:hypothetical protein
MSLSYTITDDFKVIIKSGNKKIDEVGAFDSKESAQLWAAGVINKYNSPEYVDIDYPNDLPDLES